jgi:hypothetical protein
MDLPYLRDLFLQGRSSARIGSSRLGLAGKRNHYAETC